MKKPALLQHIGMARDETEEKIKELTKATIRCIPLDNQQEEW